MLTGDMEFNMNPFNNDEQVTKAYEYIKDALNGKLAGQGYQQVHQQFDDQVFRSRYAIWSNDIDALRFTWDGKEGGFVLEVADALPLSSITAWDIIMLANYDPQKDDANYVNTIALEIIHSLG